MRHKATVVDEISMPAGLKPEAQKARPAPAKQRWFLYLLECEDGSLYTGIAVDVHLRYGAHMAGSGARYTRSHPPKRLLLCLGYADRSQASQAEYAVKRLSAAQKRAFVRRHGGAW